ncbi:hypothetical protein BOX15_Mlig020559g1 [Macrostomum lignano]|uniref:Somatostatin domain-containing protein n=2 Tax=Macrostomum lignano TaxID=282301 RepID=A0A1I8GQL1_9PLAT|nr:hypothetical protein BOX15_Mlig020559g1 [Macrostomum lignano]
MLVTQRSLQLLACLLGALRLCHPAAAASFAARDFDPALLMEEEPAFLPDDLDELIEPPPDASIAVENAEDRVLPAAPARRRSGQKLPKNWCVFHPVSCHG